MTSAGSKIGIELLLGVVMIVALSTWPGCQGPTCEENLSCPNALAADGGDSDAPDGTVDTTPPTIISISPRNGESGVRATNPIVIGFSEPMDRPSTEAAYQSADLPPEAVEMSWDGAGTVLSIVPKAPLAYAKGSDPDLVSARHYAFQLAGTALDKSGNRLSAFSSNFSTLRQINQKLAGRGSLFTLSGEHVCSAGFTPIPVGEVSSTETAKILTTVNIATLPPGIVEFQSATLSGTQLPNTYGTPYTTLGKLLIEHVHFGEPEPALMLSGAALGPATTFAISVAQASADVLDALEDDYAHRAERGNESQYRIGFERLLSADPAGAAAIFQCDQFVMDVTYLVP